MGCVGAELVIWAGLDHEVVDVLVGGSIDVADRAHGATDQEVGAHDATSVVGVDVDRANVDAVCTDLHREAGQAVYDEERSSTIACSSERVCRRPQVVFCRGVVS